MASDLVTLSCRMVRHAVEFEHKAGLLLKRNLPYPAASLAAESPLAIHHGFYIQRCTRCERDGVLTCWSLGTLGKRMGEHELTRRPLAVSVPRWQLKDSMR